MLRGLLKLEMGPPHTANRLFASNYNKQKKGVESSLEVLLTLRNFPLEAEDYGQIFTFTIAMATESAWCLRMKSFLFHLCRWNLLQTIIT